ncbi:unnamed protein product [Blepharisma stoltei]|uniref:Uncharacterized protein n=1 Tax=Blepharisma stoltei TaxID=1481888 RepID=A0AAU9IXQ1_9CILI|nr:unnamed protein product [Blepharisma stoltei]
MRNLIGLIVLIELAACISIGSKDGNLDPGRILWPKDTWVSSPIELARTNSGLTTTITFNFRPTSTLASGFVQIILPSGLSGSLSTTKTLTANQDTYISFPITLPSGAAVYGPFGIISRTSSTGQIIDANYIFGCISTTASVASSSTVTVSTVSGTANPVISTQDSLYFTFSLTQSFWRHDLIEIIPDTDWSLTSTTISCSSADIQGVTNQFYGYDGSYNLPCALATSSSDTTGPQYTSTGSKSIYIYGIDKDVLVTTSLSVKLKISTFVLPGYVKSTSNNSWIVKIWRFGTNNLLAKYSGSGPISTYVGALTFGSWDAVSDIDESSVPTGVSLFSTVTFTNTHAIPASGTAVIQFSNVDLTNNWWQDLDGSSSSGKKCYLSSTIKGASCSISSSDSSKVTISFTNQLAASTSISITLLTALTTGAKITSITTYYTGTTEIDTVSSPSTWPLSTSNKVFGHFQYHSYHDAATGSNDYPSLASSPTFTAGFLNGAYKSYDLYWAFYPGSSITWVAGTSLTVHLSISSSLSYTTSYIANDATTYDLVNALSSATPLQASSSTKITYLMSGSSISASFVTTPTASNYFIFAYHGNSALPYVASNLATFYECWAKSTTNEVGNSVFSVLIRNLEENDVYTKPLCTPTSGAIPLITLFTAVIMDIDFTSTSNVFTLEIAITNGANLGTGLTDNSDLPCTGTVSGAKCTISKTNSDADTLITVKGLGLIKAGSAVTLYIAKGILSDSIVLTPTTTIYYTPSGSDNKNYLYTSSQSTYTTGSEVTLSTGSSTTTWSISATQTLAISGAGTSAATTTGSYIGVGMPAGFTLSGSGITVASKSPTASYQATMSDQYSVGSFILGIDDGTFRLASAGSDISVAGIVAPKYAGASNGSNNIHFNVFVVLAANIGSTCDAADISKFSNTISTGTISNGDVSCSSSASSLKGPDSVDSTITITVALPHGIPKDGFVTLTMDTNWSYSYASCTVTGMSGNCQPGSSTKITASSDFSAGTITVSFLHVIPPSSGSSASCVSAVTTQDSKNNYIDSGSGFSQTINLSAAPDPGTSTITPTAIPNFAGAANADIFLSFTLSKTLPANSVLTISPGGVGTWIKSGDIKDYCWSSVVYTDCSVTNSKVQLTFSYVITSGSTVQLYLDSAITLPSSSGTTSTGFQIAATYASSTIISDSSPGALLTVNAAPSGAITLTSVKPSKVDNAGEASDYLFNFSSTQEVVSGDYFIIQFPRDFDAYIGDAENTYPDCAPGDWFLSCSSTTLGSITCAVDHWYLKVSGISKPGSTANGLDLTVKGIRNPKSGTTGNFNIWQYGSSGTLKAYQNSAISAKTSDPVANSLTLKDLVIDNTLLSGTSTYSFDFYCAGTFNSEYAFEIHFPPQFNLKLSSSATTTACTTKYYDESGSANTDSTVANDWNSATSTCSLDVATGRVTLTIPTSVSKTFLATDRIRINLSGISNAQWGLSRTDSMWDMKDTAAFGSFSEWTNRFGVSAIHTSATTISAKSYDILNAAYIGLNPSATDISANSYAPENGKGKIQLTPGTQSQDIPISISASWPMKSKSLKLKPAANSNYPDNGNLEYTSIHFGFIVYQMVRQITFRISAKTGTPQGIYYIDWTTEEEKQPGVTANLYSPPLSIMVEVCTPSTTLVPTVANIPTLYKGYKSIPIAVSLPLSPATDITITLAANSAGVSLTPTSLEFTKDSDVKFFEITVYTNYIATQTAPTITFTISGTDAAAYGPINTKTLDISSTDSKATQPSLIIAQSTVTKNSATLSISSPQNGVLYWGFSCKGSAIPTFPELVSAVADLVSPVKNTYSYQELKDMDYNNTETDVNPAMGDTDINSFFRRMHARHCATYYANAQVIYADNSAQVILDNLMAGTEYVFTAYVDNRLINITYNYTAQTVPVITSALPSVSTKSVVFSGSVPQTSSDNIRNVLAKNMGVNPSWLTLTSYASTSSRLLQASATSTFTYNVLYDRALADGYSSDTILGNLNEVQASSDFSSLYSYTTSSYYAGSTTRGTAPSWVKTPIVIEIGENAATFMATSDKAGTVYVSCTDEESDLNTYAWQVIDGLNANSNPAHADYGNWTKNQNTTLTVSGLTQGSIYMCYFTACDNYPAWPSCIDYSDDSSLVKIGIKTKASDSDAAILGFVAAFFLILN